MNIKLEPLKPNITNIMVTQKATHISLKNLFCVCCWKIVPFQSMVSSYFKKLAKRRFIIYITRTRTLGKSELRYGGWCPESCLPESFQKMSDLVRIQTFEFFDILLLWWWFFDGQKYWMIHERFKLLWNIFKNCF